MLRQGWKTRLAPELTLNFLVAVRGTRRAIMFELFEPKRKFQLECFEGKIPLSGAQWAVKSEAYAALISDHLGPRTIWLDVGCGRRLLEEDMETLENWLINHCGLIVGMAARVNDIETHASGVY